MGWEEKKGWSMQTYPGKVGIPAGLFGALPSHAVAQEIAEKNYLPEEVDKLLDGLVRKAEQRKQKRKSDDHEGRPAKKVKTESKPRPVKVPAPKKEKVVREKKTPKPKKSAGVFSTPDASSVDRRKSGRAASARKSYADRDDSDDDKEMWHGVAEWEYTNEDGTRIARPATESEAEDEDAMEVDEEAEEEPEEEVEPTPPASNGKRSLPSRSSGRKQAPVPTSSAAATPAKATRAKSAPKAKAVPKAKSPVAVKAATKPKGKAPAAKGKRAGKGKAAKEKDIFDMDESE